MNHEVEQASLFTRYEILKETIFSLVDRRLINADIGFMVWRKTEGENDD
jgi:hypothetical protein